MSRPKKPTAANHPLIAALFQELPTPGVQWDYQTRQSWLGLLSGIFDVIYSPGSRAPSFSHPPGVRGGMVGVGNASQGSSLLAGPQTDAVNHGVGLED